MTCSRGISTRSVTTPQSLRGTPAQPFSSSSRTLTRRGRLKSLTSQRQSVYSGGLLAATDDRPGVLARALGYRATQNDAENRAMMRVFEYLHDDPLPVGAKGGRRPRGRGHRVSHDSDTCLLCGASASTGAAWDTDCPEKPPAPIRSKTTCAMAVAEAANKAGLINTKRRPLDSDAVLKMYARWQREGSPREREHERASPAQPQVANLSKQDTRPPLRVHTLSRLPCNRQPFWEKFFSRRGVCAAQSQNRHRRVRSVTARALSGVQRCGEPTELDCAWLD